MVVATRAQKKQFIDSCPNHDNLLFWAMLENYLSLLYKRGRLIEDRNVIIKDIFKYLTLMLPHCTTELMSPRMNELIKGMITKAHELQQEPLSAPELQIVLQEYLDRISIFY